MYQQKNLLVGKYVPEDKAVLKEKGIKYEVLFDCQPSADVSILAVLEGSFLHRTCLLLTQSGHYAVKHS